MKQTIEKFGACFNLTLIGTPAEVAARVNTLFNYGVISNVPETFDEKTDGCVMVQTDAGRLERGFNAIAQVELQADKMLTAKYKGKPTEFLAAARARAIEMVATQFEEVPTVYEEETKRKDIYLFGSGEIHDYGWQETVS